MPGLRRQAWLGHANFRPHQRDQTMQQRVGYGARRVGICLWADSRPAHHGTETAMKPPTALPAIQNYPARPFAAVASDTQPAALPGLEVALPSAKVAAAHAATFAAGQSNLSLGHSDLRGRVLPRSPR